MQKLLLLLCLSANIVIAQPSITSFTPLSGQPGASVTISGTGFDASVSNNTVYFGAAKAIVTAASQTELTVTIPVGATYASITVLNNTTGLVGYSAQIFMPTFSPVGSIGQRSFAEHIEFFSDLTYSGSANPVLISDLNGDGKSDLIMANGSVSILINASTASEINFNTAISVSSAWQAAVGDVNGDGKPDVVVSSYGPSTSTISVLENTTTSGTWSYSRKDFSARPYAGSIALGDLDLDGRTDMAVVTDAVVSVMRNTSTAGVLTFSSPAQFTLGIQPTDCIIADLDYDGKPDIAVANTVSSTVSVLRNTSTVGIIDGSSFATKEDYSATYGTSSLAAGDVDGDGKTDLVAVNYNGGSISVLVNSSSAGDINFQDKIDFAAGDLASTVALGDVNGDGKVDVAVSNRDARTISILRNTSSPGQVAFAPKVIIDAANVPAVSLGDVNGDHKPDLVVGDAEDRRVMIYANNVKETQKLEFGALPTKTFGDPNFSLSATGGGTGNPVVFTSSNTGVATISGNVVTIVGAGTTTITAYQAGSDTYDPVEVLQPLVVNKAEQIITFPAISDKTFGQPPFSLIASSSSMLPVRFVTGYDNVMITSNQATIIRAGKVTIIASQPGNENYNPASSVDQTFCINPERPVVTISNIASASLTLRSNALSGNQWYLSDAPIEGATQNTLSVNSVGVYRVRVTIDGCVSEFSETLIITDAEQGPTANPITVSPNPASDILTVGLGRESGQKTVSVFDVTGKRFYTDQIDAKQTDLNISDYPHGLYLLKVQTSSNTTFLRFLKQ